MGMVALMIILSMPLVPFMYLQAVIETILEDLDFFGIFYSDD